MRARVAKLLPALALTAGLTATPLAADQDEIASARASLASFQALDQRLQDIGWRLAQGNAEFCEKTTQGIGLQLIDAQGFGAPAIIREALGLEGSFAVQTAAKGSPAWLSGMFRPGREVVAIGTAQPNQWEADERRDWKRLTRLHDHIDMVLTDKGGVTIEFANGSLLALAGVPICKVRFELLSGSDEALADIRRRVLLGAKSETFEYSDDVLAALIAHEFAHIVLEHPQWLEANKRSKSNVRASEREADRLIPWLLANAGYDPQAAPQFFEQYQPRSGQVLFLAGSHDKWEARAENARKEIKAIAALLATGQKPDWSEHFEREKRFAPAR